jgi:hypothetical protein
MARAERLRELQSLQKYFAEHWISPGFEYEPGEEYLIHSVHYNDRLHVARAYPIRSEPTIVISRTTTSNRYRDEPEYYKRESATLYTSRPTGNRPAVIISASANPFVYTVVQDLEQSDGLPLVFDEHNIPVVGTEFSEDFIETGGDGFRTFQIGDPSNTSVRHLFSLVPGRPKGVNLGKVRRVHYPSLGEENTIADNFDFPVKTVGA